jgi:hypothetical protein
MPLSENQEKLLKLFEEHKGKNHRDKTVALREIKTIILGNTNIIFSEEVYGCTLLHTAVYERQLDLVNIICEHNACSDLLPLRTKADETAVDFALLEGIDGRLHLEDFNIFKALISAGAACDFININDRFEKRYKDAESEEIKTVIKLFTDFIGSRPKSLGNTDGTLSIYAYPSLLKDQAQQKESERQKSITERFFHVGIPLKKGKKSTTLYGEMRTALDMKWEVKLDGWSSRAAVIAISKLLQKLELFPPITFKIGETILQCRSGEYRTRQIGNLMVTIVSLGNIAPKYGATIMLKYINPLIGTDASLKAMREKRLGFLFTKKSKILESFTFDDFHTSGRIKASVSSPSYVSVGTLQDQRVNNSIHVLNFLNFMYMIGETTRRLYRDQYGKVASPPRFQRYGFPEPPVSDAIPVGNLHARAFKLLRLGRIRINDLFGDSGTGYDCRPRYGVVSGVHTITNVVSQVKPKCLAVNELMSDYHKNKYLMSTKSAAMLQSHYFMTRSSGFYGELKAQFGGESESDSDDTAYGSDSETEYLNVELECLNLDDLKIE